jgi:hypothetical protein
VSTIPIRTLHDAEARWALEAQPGDLVPVLPSSPYHAEKDFHIVAEKSVTLGRDDIWVVIACSCGLTFSGALRQ